MSLWLVYPMSPIPFLASCQLEWSTAERKKTLKGSTVMLRVTNTMTDLHMLLYYHGVTIIVNELSFWSCVRWRREAHQFVSLDDKTPVLTLIIYMSFRFKIAAHINSMNPNATRPRVELLTGMCILFIHIQPFVVQIWVREICNTENINMRILNTRIKTQRVQGSLIHAFYQNFTVGFRLNPR